MNTWRVLKLSDVYRPQRSTLEPSVPAFIEVGTLNSRYAFSPPQAQDIGEAYGEGSFLLIGSDESTGLRKVVETTIVTDRPTYVEAETEVAA